MAVIFCLSSIPGREIDLPSFPNSDKIMHFLAYSALGWLISLRHGLQNRRPSGIDMSGIAVGALYGVSDEIHQLFVPFRDFDPADMAADFLGVTAACWAYGRLYRMREAKAGSDRESASTS